MDALDRVVHLIGRDHIDQWDSGLLILGHRVDMMLTFRHGHRTYQNVRARRG
jgi:hypothetical protein